MSAASIFVAGADAFGCAVAALLFLRARFRTQDYLFVFFSAAFALLAVNECTLVIERLKGEGTALSDLVRLVAFALMLGAVGYRSIARHGH